MKDRTLQSGGSRVTHGSRSEVLGMETAPAAFSRGLPPPSVLGSLL